MKRLNIVYIIPAIYHEYFWCVRFELGSWNIQIPDWKFQLELKLICTLEEYNVH